MRPILDTHLTRRLAGERGAALVEFTLVLPLLLVVLLAIFAFGKVFNYWIDETHLANVAARYAAVNKNPGPAASLQESIQAQANTEELRNGGTSEVPSGAVVCIRFPDPANPSADNPDPQIGDPVQAQVRVTYHFIPFLAGRINVASKELQAKAQMRLEARPTNYGAGCAGPATV